MRDYLIKYRIFFSEALAMIRISICIAFRTCGTLSSDF